MTDCELRLYLAYRLAVIRNNQNHGLHTGSHTHPPYLTYQPKWPVCEMVGMWGIRMWNSQNHESLNGRLTNRPCLKYRPNGRSVCSYHSLCMLFLFMVNTNQFASRYTKQGILCFAYWPSHIADKIAGMWDICMDVSHIGQMDDRYA